MYAFLLVSAVALILSAPSYYYGSELNSQLTEVASKTSLFLAGKYDALVTLYQSTCTFSELFSSARDQLESWSRDKARQTVDYLRCPPIDRYLWYYTVEQSTYCKYYHEIVGPTYNDYNKLNLMYLTYAFVSWFLTLWPIIIALRAWRKGVPAVHVLREDLSYFLPHSSTQYNACSHLRKVFRTTPVPRAKPKLNHTHGNEASKRESANAFLRAVASKVALEPYYFQCAPRDKDARGSKAFYWSKDPSTPSSHYSPQPQDMLIMVDVDYYVDMPLLLSSLDQPLMLYTFSPSQTARVTENYSYRFMDDQTAEYVVSGGATYRSHIWNYANDALMTTKFLFGVIPWRVTTYNVERRPLGPDHSVIAIIPTQRWRCFRALIAHLLLPVTPLRKMAPCNDGYARMHIRSEHSHQVSTSITGNYTAAVVPVDIDEAVAAAARLQKTALAYPTVQGLTGTTKSESLILTEYHSSQSAKSAEYVYPVQDGMVSYTYFNSEYTGDEQDGMVSFMNPPITGVCVPTSGKANDLAFVNERVTKLRSRDFTMTTFASKLIDEFICLAFPEPHQLYPVTYECVLEKQAKPTQRHILHSSELEDPLDDRTLSTFMKKEAYAGLKDPRAITTLPGAFKREYSRYMYSMADHLKKQAWYAFGATPAMVAQRVANICQSSDSVGLGDFHRFDGHVSNLIREFESRLLVRAFHQDHSADVHDLHARQDKLVARTSFGVNYATGSERKSGSPETSALNTWTNKFMDYCARRRASPPATPEQAFHALGIFGGDDSLVTTIDAKVAETTAMEWGMVLVMETKHKGDMGVNFLARIYGPDVWYGSPNSMCDIARTMAKFHLTVRMPSNVTSEDKALAKAECLACFDHDTPFIGQLCAVIISHGRGGNARVDAAKEIVKPYMLTHAETPDSWYPNNYEPWMETVLYNSIPDFDMAMFQKACCATSMREFLTSGPYATTPKEHTAKQHIATRTDIVGPRGSVHAREAVRPADSQVEYGTKNAANSALAPDAHDPNAHHPSVKPSKQKQLDNPNKDNQQHSVKKTSGAVPRTRERKDSFDERVEQINERRPTRVQSTGHRHTDRPKWRASARAKNNKDHRRDLPAPTKGAHAGGHA